MIHRELPINVSDRQEPAWKERVDRWYQLDEIGFAVSEAIWQWKTKDLPSPKLVILAMEGLSTVADFDFVNSGASSPAKFVFTLPNIAASVLFQVLGIHCKVYCLNSGTATEEAGVEHAQRFSKIYDCIWVLSSPPGLENGKRVVRLAIAKN